MQTVRWLFWCVWYKLRGRPKDFGGFMKATVRTFSPWFQFKPYLWHHDEMREWEVYFAADRDYYSVELMKVGVCRSLEDDRIVGIRVFDECMGPKSPVDKAAS